MKSSRHSGTLKDAGHIGSGLRSGCTLRRQNGREHSAEHAKQRIAGAAGRQAARTDAPPHRPLFSILRRSSLVPVRPAGLQQAEAPSSAAPPSARWRYRDPAASAGRPWRGKLLCRWLRASRQQLLQRAARDIRVGVETGGSEVIGMRNHAVAGVRRVADVAVFDVDVLAVADIGDADGYVLRARPVAWRRRGIKAAATIATKNGHAEWRGTKTKLMMTPRRMF